MTDNLFAPQEGAQQNSNVDPTPEQQAPQAQESNPSQQIDPNTLFANQLAAITSDDGRQKYADVNTALSSIPHAQSHIKSLENQLAQMQEELNKRQGMEQVLERIQATQDTNAEPPSANSIDAAQLSELVNSQLNQREQAQAAMANEVAFSDSMREKFGDKAIDVLGAKASELGISLDFMQSLAQKSPKAALKYFEDTPQPMAQPTTPSSQTDSLVVQTPEAQGKLDEARAKLFGTQNPNIDKWREAGSTINRG